MSDIRQSLEGLGLGQYADAFDENDIDARALRSLTDQDMKDIGVASLGHRRILLGAIDDISSAAPRDSAAALTLIPPLSLHPHLHDYWTVIRDFVPLFLVVLTVGHVAERRPIDPLPRALTKYDVIDEGRVLVVAAAYRHVLGN